MTEPEHDKSNKRTVRPAKTQAAHAVWLETSLSARRNLGFLATHWAHIEDSADAQADLSLVGIAHQYVGFVMLRLHYNICTKLAILITLKQL